MNKELFLKAVLQSADRLVAKAIEADLADGIWDLQLISTTSMYDTHGDIMDVCERITFGEELCELVDGSWRLEDAYRCEKID